MTRKENEKKIKETRVSTITYAHGHGLEWTVRCDSAVSACDNIKMFDEICKPGSVMGHLCVRGQGPVPGTVYSCQLNETTLVIYI